MVDKKEKEKAIEEIENQDVDSDKPVNIPETIPTDPIDDKTDIATQTSQRDIETQQEIAREKAASDAKKAQSKKDQTKKNSQLRRSHIDKKQKNESYKRTLNRIQGQLPASDRFFSKIIHGRIIEKISDAIGSTIARPNAILSGSIVAFILTLLTYTTAKQIGYGLSGYETIIAFAVGWIIGILYDYLRLLFVGKK